MEEDVFNSMATLNSNAKDAMLECFEDIHGATDVTGFGLAGHTLELARGSKLTAQIQWNQVPLLSNVQSLADQGIITGASDRNWQSYGAEVRLPEQFSPAQQALLTDPQTSGGLLVSCSADVVNTVLEIFKQHHFASACVIGQMTNKQDQYLEVLL